MPKKNSGEGLSHQRRERRSQDMKGKKAGFDIDRIIEGDAEDKRTRQKGHREITLKEYLELVQKDPLIPQRSPARLLEIFMEQDEEPVAEEEQWIVGAKSRFPLISSKLYGIERCTEEFVQYLRAGANRLSTGKQVLLFVGPPASGKSSFLIRLKRALETYNKRPVFCIKDCPMHEDPLHALPRYMRRSHWDEEKAGKVGLEQPIEDMLGISNIEGDLCPHCRIAILEDYKVEEGVVRWWDVKVENLSFSIQGGRGIGSFEPSDEKSQDVGDLVGHENIGITANPKYGRGHRNSFWLDGELEKGNRGITEGREFLKKGIDERFLWAFINVAEEQEIKVQGSSFPHIAVDTVVIGHCNLAGLKAFSVESGHEALHDRIYMIPFPYPLRVRDEVRVYRKLIVEESSFRGLRRCHIDPGSLELAATFAIFTRIKESNMGVDPLTKIKAYNGEKILAELVDNERRPLDLVALVDEGQRDDDIARREGMFGVSSRDVLAGLNTAIVQEPEGGCLTPLRTLRALREVFRHRMRYTPEEISHFMELLTASEGSNVVSELENFAVEQVSKAFLCAFSDLSEELFSRYIKEIEYDRTLKRRFVRSDSGVSIRRDPTTGKPKDPDKRLMRSVEEFVPIGEAEADTFRGEILEYQASHPDFGPDTYEPLRRAIEKKLLADARSSLTLVLATDKPKGDEERQRAKDLFDSLQEQGFCEVGAKEIVQKAADILNA